MGGAAGYVLKQIKANDLVESIRTVAAGGSLLDPAQTQRVLDRIRNAGDEDGPVSEDLRRCPRCLEIRRFVNLRCVSCGYRNGELAEMPAIYSERCPRCRRLVAATIGGLCGLCAARAEYDLRKKVGTLSRSDRTERMYAKA